MASYNNFFETVKEANMRLHGTVVLYDGKPYMVMCITNHKSDGIWRIYLDPIGFGETGLAVYADVPPPCAGTSPENPALGEKMDAWLDSGFGSKTRVIRKMMNSPKFNKFRPYPLGMVHQDGMLIYVERHPTRKSEQGLTSNMLVAQTINLSPSLNKSCYIDIYGRGFADCIEGSYPSPDECLVNLKDKDVINESAAFHRHFALLRGPMNLLFLAYKTDVVGILVNGDFSCLRLSPEFAHTKEVIELLALFQSIITE